MEKDRMMRDEDKVAKPLPMTEGQELIRKTADNV
jgi:hypothetical protein